MPSGQQIAEITYRHQMGRVQIFGDLSEREMKELGETLRDELVRQPGYPLSNSRRRARHELSIEVSKRASNVIS